MTGTCIEDLPTRLDTEEEELIEIEDEDANKGHEPQEPICLLDSRPEQGKKDLEPQIYLLTILMPVEGEEE